MALQQVWPLLTRFSELLSLIIFPPNLWPKYSYFVLTCLLVKSKHRNMYFREISTRKVAYSGSKLDELMALQQVWPLLTRFSELLSSIIFPPNLLPKCSYFVLTYLLVKFKPSQTVSNKYFWQISTSKVAFSSSRLDDTMALQQVLEIYSESII